MECSGDEHKRITRQSKEKIYKKNCTHHKVTHKREINIIIIIKTKTKKHTKYTSYCEIEEKT